ncbi:MAG: hypothetical protein HYV09_11215 [Deltaproteobacteria bacterium]|nr:hypothetical protein [Deltaproteobacteria bacterium]
MRSHIRLGALAAVTFAAAVLTACTPADDPRKALVSQGCTLNSDCNAPLICAFRTCHEQCTSSRDCPSGARCVAGEKPHSVCQLPDERDCQTNADCAAGQVCGVDDQCRDACKTDRDCLVDQVCVVATCADPRELKDGTLEPSTRSDAGSDAPRGFGLPCEYTSQCPDPLVCRRDVCDHECLGDRDCEGGKACVDRVCRVRITDGGTCGAGLIACGSDASPVCVDPARDRSHCGGCDKACAVGEVCDRGACALSCPSGMVDCGGSCRVLASDRSNCGACGTTCATGQVCSGGACVASCSAPLVECSGGCHDLQVDPLHCGACGNVCTAGRSCTAGSCQIVCGSGTSLCGSACRDLAVDPNNCGTCGNVCPTGKSCVSGSCT